MPNGKEKRIFKSFINPRVIVDLDTYYSYDYLGIHMRFQGFLRGITLAYRDGCTPLDRIWS
jgi:hypothetical protein